MTKTKEKKFWFTVADLTVEGSPHKAAGAHNFTQKYCSHRILREDLQGHMSSEMFHRGAYVAAAWPGRLSEWDCLHGPTKPIFYVHQGGRIERP